MPPKNRAFVATLVPILLLDRLTKLLALAHLPTAIPRQVLGNWVRFTLVYNRGAAMDLTLGAWSRWGFSVIAVAGVVLMISILRQSAAPDWLRGATLGAISAGAIGNLLDRLLSDRGVIDFIDVGIGAHRFWVFNVADVGVTVGAVTLAVIFSREGKRA